MFKSLQFLFLLSYLRFLQGFLVTDGTTDYCSQELCPLNGRHIACHHDMKLSKNCPEKVYLVNVTDHLKDFIVDSHNMKRNLLAGGDIDGHKPACRMATIQWDDELARLATLNVMQCRMQHDECRNTPRYRSSGQNIAWRSYYNIEYTQKQVLEDALTDWFSEYKYSDMSYIDSYRPKPSPGIGHFTAMVIDRNIRVGCGWIAYQEDHSDEVQHLITCNYAVNNIRNQRIYESCDQPAAHCNTGVNKHYPNLCSLEETYHLA